jgi:hypothetical protein
LETVLGFETTFETVFGLVTATCGFGAAGTVFGVAATCGRMAAACAAPMVSSLGRLGPTTSGASGGAGAATTGTACARGAGTVPAEAGA